MCPCIVCTELHSTLHISFVPGSPATCKISPLHYPLLLQLLSVPSLPHLSTVVRAYLSAFSPAAQYEARHNGSATAHERRCCRSKFAGFKRERCHGGGVTAHGLIPAGGANQTDGGWRSLVEGTTSYVSPLSVACSVWDHRVFRSFPDGGWWAPCGEIDSASSNACTRRVRAPFKVWCVLVFL